MQSVCCSCGNGLHIPADLLVLENDLAMRAAQSAHHPV